MSLTEHAERLAAVLGEHVHSNPESIDQVRENTEFFAEQVEACGVDFDEAQLIARRKAQFALEALMRDGEMPLEALVQTLSGTWLDGFLTAVSWEERP